MFVSSLGLIDLNKYSSIYTIKNRWYQNFTGLDILKFKLNIFKFLNRLIYGSQRINELFPPITKLQNINNSKYGAKNCAADDLELGFSNDQIEFFDHQQHLHHPHHHHNHNHNHHHSDPKDHHVDLNTPVYLQQSMDHFEDSVPLTLPIFDDFIEAHQPKNYFNERLNIQQGFEMFESMNKASYFNDFSKELPKRIDYVSSSSVSSTESYLSPLDDEIFGKFQKSEPERKRKSDDDLSPKRTYKKKKITKIDESYNVITTTTTTNNTTVRKTSFTSKNGSIDHIFECPHCDATFKVKGYLTRHLKKHNSSKAFLCPFYQEVGKSGTKCHPTGGFSRRDTFKTHLKALHFIYPPGTKSNERGLLNGRCAGCFQFFDNNIQWLEKHIELGKCQGTVSYKEDINKILLTPGDNNNDDGDDFSNIKIKNEFDDTNL